MQATLYLYVRAGRKYTGEPAGPLLQDVANWLVPASPHGFIEGRLTRGNPNCSPASRFD
jgi:hypothetical protein